MGSVRNILATLLAIAVMLGASAWSSAASACLYENTMNVVGGAQAPVPATHLPHQQHRIAMHHQSPAPASPGGPRLDCAACIAVLPAFPAIGSRELMPFMAEAREFEPLPGIAPALDPPPPRRAAK